MTEKPSELLPEEIFLCSTDVPYDLAIYERALDDTYVRYVKHTRTTLPVERGVLEELKREADSAYCRALDVADKNCRGRQYKLENGLFGNDDLNWHCKHNELIGYHRGIYAALAKIDLIMEKKNG
jgi:hypothetical protein